MKDHESIVAKRRSTCENRYGTDSASRLETTKRKAVLSYFHRTGYLNSMHNPSARRKLKRTMIERYGVSSAFQLRRSIDNSMKSAFRFKTVADGSRVFKFQGYEDIAYFFLRRTLASHHILGQCDAGFPPPVPVLGSKSMYYPDMFVPPLSSFVEVKSKWTLVRDSSTFDRAKRKAESVLNSGVGFRMIMVESILGGFTAFFLPDDWVNWSLKRTRSWIDGRLCLKTPQFKRKDGKVVRCP